MTLQSEHHRMATQSFYDFFGHIILYVLHVLTVNIKRLTEVMSILLSLIFGELIGSLLSILMIVESLWLSVIRNFLMKSFRLYYISCSIKK